MQLRVSEMGESTAASTTPSNKGSRKMNNGGASSSSVSASLSSKKQKQKTLDSSLLHGDQQQPLRSIQSFFKPATTPTTTPIVVIKTAAKKQQQPQGFTVASASSLVVAGETKDLDAENKEPAIASTSPLVGIGIDAPPQSHQSPTPATDDAVSSEEEEENGKANAMELDGETDKDGGDEEEEKEGVSAASTPAVRPTRKRISYKEDSTEEEDNTNTSSSSEEEGVVGDDFMLPLEERGGYHHQTLTINGSSAAASSSNKKTKSKKKKKVAVSSKGGSAAASENEGDAPVTPPAMKRFKAAAAAVAATTFNTTLSAENIKTTFAVPEPLAPTSSASSLSLSSRSNYVAELRNFKVYFASEKKINFHFHNKTLQELGEFRAWLDGKQRKQDTSLLSLDSTSSNSNNNFTDSTTTTTTSTSITTTSSSSSTTTTTNVTTSSAIAVFPTAFYGLIAKLVQESDQSIAELSKSVKTLLCPPTLNASTTYIAEEIISMKMLNDVIQKVATRVNYGIQLPNANPKNLAIWRWEVVDMDLLAVDDIKELVILRKSVRDMARQQLYEQFKALDEADRIELIASTKKKGRASITSSSSAINDAVQPMDSSADGVATTEQTSASSTPSGSKSSLSVVSSAKAIKMEEKKRERERKEEEKRVEREKKEEEKRVEREKKESEKVAKDEEKRLEREKKEAEKQAVKDARDEIKKKKEDEKKKKEESQKRISNFFNSVKKEEVVVESVPDDFVLYRDLFPPFYVKTHVHLSPVNRFHHPLNTANFEEVVFKDSVQVDKKQILAELKASSCARKYERLLDRKFNDLVVMDGVNLLIGDRSRKLMQFHEDLRPAYYGTFSKTSDKINGRRPLHQDSNLFDYDYDSEAEWEEDEPGEELNSDNEGDDEEGPAEDGEGDEDDGWLVPHGYLSDDERMEDDEDLKKSKEAANATAKRKQLEKLVAIIVGPVFRDELFASKRGDQHPMLFDCSAKMLRGGEEGNIDPFAEASPDSTSPRKDNVEKKAGKKNTFPAEYMNELLQVIVQGGNKGINKLVDELREKIPAVPKSQIEAKIREVAVKEKRQGQTKQSWHLKK